MNATKLLALGLLVLGLFGMVGMASAATITDGGDDVYFDNELITISNWAGCGTYPNDYLWVTNSTNASFIEIYAPVVGTSSVNDLLGNGTNIKNNLTSACVYTFNASDLLVDNAGYVTYYIHIKNSNSESSPAINTSTDSSAYVGYVQMNNFTLTVYPNASQDLGALSGDNVTVVITTNGAAAAYARENAQFSVSTTESGVTATKVTDTGAPDGVQTYKIAVGSTAVNQANLTVTNGYSLGNSTYAVRKFNIQAYDRTAGTSEGSKIIFETLFENGTRANFASTANLVFNVTVSRDGDYWTGGLTNYTIYNITFTNGTNYSAVTNALNVSSTAGTGTITVMCQNLTLSDSDTYTVRSGAQNITIVAKYLNVTAQDTFYVSQNVTINGWINNASENVTLNISYVNATNGRRLVLLSTNVTPASDGSWNSTWDTTSNFTIESWAETATQFLTGVYEIFAYKDNNMGQNTTSNVTLTEALSVDTVNSTHLGGAAMTDQAYIGDMMTLTGSSSRINGSTILTNITGPTGSGYTNWTNLTSVVGAGLWLIDGNYSVAWNTSGANATGTYTALVSTGATNTTKTFTLLNNLTMTLPTTGPLGSQIVITGKSSRPNFTAVNLTVLTAAPVFSVLTQENGSNNATVIGGNWTYTWNTTVDGKGGSASLPAGTYTVIVSDNVSSVSQEITLQTASVSMSAAKTDVYVDEQLNITGTTNFPEGQGIQINVTNCTGGNITNFTAVVNASQMFNLSLIPTSDTYLNAYLAANGTLQSGAARICLVAANGTGVSTTMELSVKDDLALASKSEVVSGDKVEITGTTGRSNATKLTVGIATSTGIYNKSTTTDVYNQNMAYSAGTFYNNTLYATQTGASGGGDLAAGSYLIYVNDSYRVVSMDVTVLATGTVTITAPTTNQNISIGDQFVITGTSNRANGTNVQIQIAGINSTTINTNATTDGTWSRVWNTTGYVAGTYTVIASHNGTSDTIATVVAQLIAGATTTTTTTTTQPGETTTTTTQVGECVLAGNSAPCDEISLEEAVDGITAWSNDEMSLADVVALIDAWATGVAS